MHPQREEKNSMSILRRASPVFGPKIFCTASTFSNPLKNSVNRWYFTGTVRGIVTPTDRGLKRFAMPPGSGLPPHRGARRGRPADDPADTEHPAARHHSRTREL